MRGIMIQGTSSDAGKSYITTALCRILSDAGVQVAPFKSQNMSNNSYVTIQGKEMGRAQGVQAEAARVIPNVHMNPILLKPRKDTQSEVIVHGEVYRSYSGMAYGKEFTLTKGMEAVNESLTYLDQHYEMVVIEGAGSPAEVNLNHREIVNMRIAQAADVDVILVTDIDRGGSFASLVGTIELVFEHRHRIKGVIFNKFRGDIKLLEDGLRWFEDYTKIPVVGVIPYAQDIHIETEDAQSRQKLFQEKHADHTMLDIVIIHMERVSNNTDIEPFIYEEDVALRLVRTPEEFGTPDAVIIPGTKSTIGDVRTLQESGLGKVIKEYAAAGGRIVGVCGGYQVLGERLMDPEAVDEVVEASCEGLGILPIQTTFFHDKRVKQVKGHIKPIGIFSSLKDDSIEGYEIHLGQTSVHEPFIELEDGTVDGMILDGGRIIGTYLHNFFHNDGIRHAWLEYLRQNKGIVSRPPVHTKHLKEENYNRLAAHVKEHLDMDRVYKIINKETIEL